MRNKIAVLDNVLQTARTRGLMIQSTAADVAAFWQARDEVKVDASYLPGPPVRYAGTIRTGAHAARDLTVEFGDVITAFDCDGCAAPQIVGKRVTMRGALAPATTYAFQATVGGVFTAPAVPTLPGRWLLGLAAVLLAMAACGPGRWVARLVAAAILLQAAPCRAETTPYCTRIGERAEGDAALLVAPRLLVQGLRFPDNGTVEGGIVTGERISSCAAASPMWATDFYKGLGLRQIADADCRAHDARVTLESALADSVAAARRAGLQAQAPSPLDAHAGGGRARPSTGRSPASRHTPITLIELEDVRGRAATLERMAMQARGQAAQLAAKAHRRELPSGRLNSWRAPTPTRAAISTGRPLTSGAPTPSSST